MSDERRDIGHVLKSVGDSYIQNEAADLATVRAGVERYRRRRTRFIWGGAVLATGTAVLIAFFATSSNAPDDDPLPPAQEAPLSIVHEVRLEGSPLQVAAKENVAWVTRVDDRLISRVEVGAAAPVWEREIGAVPGDIVATSDGLWIADHAGHRILQLDPETGEGIGAWGLDGAPGRIAVGGSAIRTTVDGIGVVRIDRTTDQQRLIYRGSVIDIAMGESAFWVMNTDGHIVPIDPDNGNPVAGLESPSVVAEGEITYLRGAIYYGFEGNRTLIRIDEGSGAVTGRIQLPAGYQDIDADSESLWVLVREGGLGRLLEMDPVTGTTGGEGIDLQDDPVDIVTGEDGVWVALASGGRVVLVR